MIVKLTICDECNKEHHYSDTIAKELDRDKIKTDVWRKMYNKRMKEVQLHCIVFNEEYNVCEKHLQLALTKLRKHS